MNELRELREASGASYTDIERRGGLPRSTAHAMVKKDATLPTRPEKVRQFVVGCGESQESAEKWVARWRKLRGQEQNKKARIQVQISRPVSTESRSCGVVEIEEGAGSIKENLPPKKAEYKHQRTKWSDPTSSPRLVVLLAYMVFVAIVSVMATLVILSRF